MAEVIGLVASIIQVAAFGLNLSRTLYDYSSSVVGAEKRLKGLDRDIAFTSRIISQLGSRLENSQVQALAMEDVVAKVRSSNMGKWTIFFRESKIELMRANLDRMKGNLQLLIGVIIHSTQMANEQPDDASVAAHRSKIRELMLEKEYYTQRYLEEKRRYDDLLAKFNSTSTLNSVLTFNSIGDARPEDEIDKESQTDRSTTCTPGPSTVPSNATQPQTISTQASHFPPFRTGSKPQLFSTTSSPHLPLPSQNTATNAAEASAGPSFQLESPSSALVQSAALDLPVPSSTIVSGESRPRKRDRVAKAAKNTAQAAGIAACVVAGVATFPITVPAALWYLLRKRRLYRKNKSQAADSLLPFPNCYGFDPLSQSNYQQPPLPLTPAHFQTSMSQSTHGMSQSAQYGYELGPSMSQSIQYGSGSGYDPGPRYQQYASAQLRAELPAIHELSPQTGAVELGLVNRLTTLNISPFSPPESISATPRYEMT